MEKFNQKKSCPFSNAMELIGGKWKILIIGRINENKKIRFNELRKVLSTVSYTHLRAHET